MPACAIINKDMEILKFRGLTSVYLSHQSGNASLNILKMTRPEFTYELRNAIDKAFKTRKIIRMSDIEIKIDSVFRRMSFEIRPIEIEWGESILLIVFMLHEQTGQYIENGKKGKNIPTAIGTAKQKQRIKKLIDKLESTRSEMQSVINSQETAYEKLQVANEEIVSTNEEFQTLNEELETSKEEIESTNEEIISTNNELQMRNSLLYDSFMYSEAIIATIHEPMVVLDNKFCVRTANKAFYKK
jgi:two-component system CheB/CheR fusion protein